MRRILLKQFVLFSAIVLLINPVYAQTEIEFLDAKITFEIPGDSLWKIASNNVKKDSPGGMLDIKREVIKDSTGREIIVAIGMIFKKVPLNVNWNEYITLTVARMEIVGDIYKILNYEDGAFSMQPATALYTNGFFRGRDFTMITCLFLNKGVGLVVICTATDGMFDKVEQEMLDFIKSIVIK